MAEGWGSVCNGYRICMSGVGGGGGGVGGALHMRAIVSHLSNAINIPPANMRL